MARARDKPHNVWGNPLIKSSFIFKVQQREREYIYNRSQHFDLSKSNIDHFESWWDQLKTFCFNWFSSFCICCTLLCSTIMLLPASSCCSWSLCCPWSHTTPCCPLLICPSLCSSSCCPLCPWHVHSNIIQPSNSIRSQPNCLLPEGLLFFLAWHFQPLSNSLLLLLSAASSARTILTCSNSLGWTRCHLQQINKDSSCCNTRFNLLIRVSQTAVRSSSYNPNYCYIYCVKAAIDISQYVRRLRVSS